MSGPFGPIVSAIALGVFCSAALAQEGRRVEEPPEPGSIEELSLADLLNGKVVAASLQEESASEAPSSITVFTQADIARMGILTVEQLLNFVPGFQGTTDAGNGLFRFSTRGRSTTPHEYVLVLVDGQRLNDVYSGGAMDTIPTENIQQIEVIRGPGSALYGANAFLGVINIKTNREANNLTVGAGNLNSRYLVLNLARLLGTVQVGAFARFYSDDGFTYQDIADVDGRVGPAADPTQTIEGHLALERKGLALTLQHRERRFWGMSCCTPYSQYSDRTERQRSSGQLSYQRRLARALELHAAASLALDRSLAVAAVFPRGTIPDVRSGVTLGETYLFGTYWTGYTGAGNLDMRWQLRPLRWLSGTVTGGASYEYVQATEVDDVSSHDPSWQYQGDPYRFPQPTVNRQVAAGFLQAKLEFLSLFHLTTGVRLDRYSDFGTALSPRAALVWITPFRSDLKLMAGRAFRAPSFGELYDRSRRVALSGATVLRPETVDTLEVAYVQQVVDYASASITYFRNHLDNIIQPPENGLPYRNLGSSRVQGVEIGVRTRDLNGLSALGSYTHLIPSEDEKDSLLVPLDFGSAAVNYCWRRLTLNLNAIMRGDSRTGGYIVASVASSRFLTHAERAYVLLNGHLQVQVAPAIRMGAIVDNALDHRYDRSDDPHPSPGLLTRGRTLMFDVKVDF